MRTIVAGSREFDDWPLVYRLLDGCPWRIDTVISGACRGVDEIGERWAASRGVSVARFPARWDEHGRSAGPRRNAEMVAGAGALVAVWDGRSRGTRDIIVRAKAGGLETLVYIRAATP